MGATSVHFEASNMILKIHSDASYLTESQALSQKGGHFSLGNKDNSMLNNGAIHFIAKIIKKLFPLPLKLK